MFVEPNDDDFNEMKEGNGIDHLIKILTEVTRLLSQENDTMEEIDVATGSEAVGKRSSVLTGVDEDEVNPTNNDLVKDASVQTDWYESNMREESMETTRSGLMLNNALL